MFVLVLVLLIFMIFMILKKSGKKFDSDESVLKKILFQERYGAFFDFFRRPFFYFHKKPFLSFLIGLPAAFLFLFWTDSYFHREPESFLLLFLFISFLPFMYFEEIKQRKINFIEERMPSFLRELSEFCGSGLTLPESFEKAADSVDSRFFEISNENQISNENRILNENRNSNKKSKRNLNKKSNRHPNRNLNSAPPGDFLTNEIRLMGLQMNAGVSFETCLEDFGNRYDSLLICRAASIIQVAEKSGGDISLTLDAAAFDFEESVFAKKERDSKQTVYAVVFSASFLLLVGVSVLLIFQFDALSGLSPTSVLNDSYPQMNRIIFHLLFIQALFAGLMIGKLKKRNIFIGVKYSFLLMFFVWIAFLGIQKFI